jgi:hypothetical protein
MSRARLRPSAAVVGWTALLVVAVALPFFMDS